MKSLKLIIVLVFSIVCGNNFVNAQQNNSDGNKNSPAVSVQNGNTSARSVNKTKNGKNKKAKTKKNNLRKVNTDETLNLRSKSEREARALTAEKTRKSGKGNIPPERAKKERAARIAAIIEANKTKKKTPSKRKN